MKRLMFGFICFVVISSGCAKPYPLKFQKGEKVIQRANDMPAIVYDADTYTHEYNITYSDKEGEVHYRYYVKEYELEKYEE